MSESQVRRICNLEVPNPIKVGNKWYLAGLYGNVEVAGAMVNPANRLDRMKVRVFIRKQVKCITGCLDSVDSLIEDINPRLYGAWF